MQKEEKVAVIWRRIFRIFIPFLWDTVTNHADTRPPHITMCLEVRLANLAETCGGLGLARFGGTTVVSELVVVAISLWKFVLFSCSREGKGRKEEN